MKKLAIGALALVCVIVWGVRYYTLNETFLFHPIFPEEVYSMHETVGFDDCKSYNVIKQPEYTISLDNARIVEASDYLEEIGKKEEDFNYFSERYLELTLTVSNENDDKGYLDFYGLPIMGTNWFTFFNNEMTACINPYFEDDFNVAFACKVEKNSTATVKLAYSLRYNNFSSKQWEDFNNQKIWLWVTLQPIDKRIEIEL